MPSARDVAVSVVNRVPPPMAAAFQSGRFLARTAAPVIERLLPTGLTEVVVRSGSGRGLRLVVDPQHEKFYWTGTYERAVQAAFEELLRPGDTFWDIGAHIGFFSLIASRLVGPDGRVHAFEPIAANRRRLLTSLERNGATNITLHECAVSDTSDERFLFAGAGSATWTLVERHEANGIPIHCMTIDEFAASGPPPALIKIDVEGAELDVLGGGLEFIARQHPRLLVEFHDEPLLAAARELLPKYDFRLLDENHWLLV